MRTFLINLFSTCFMVETIYNTVRSEGRCALIKVLEVMSTSVHTGLNPFNFIRKHFLQICL
jgi:hypothetical protein